MGFNDERKRMNEGELYRSNDAEILKEQLQWVEKLYDYNVTRPSEKQKRKGLLKEMFAVIGDVILNHHFMLIGVGSMYILVKEYMPISI